MPLQCFGCSSALVLGTALALLVVPPRYFIPDSFLSSDITLEHESDQLGNLDVASAKNLFGDYFRYQSVDFFPNVIIVVIGFIVYLFEWIHRKLLERRILKLRTFLGTSTERLREADARREQLEDTLKLARGAAAEYNLLLYLLLRRRKDERDAAHDAFA